MRLFMKVYCLRQKFALGALSWKRAAYSRVGSSDAALAHLRNASGMPVANVPVLSRSSVRTLPGLGCVCIPQQKRIMRLREEIIAELFL